MKYVIFDDHGAINEAYAFSSLKEAKAQRLECVAGRAEGGCDEHFQAADEEIHIVPMPESMEEIAEIHNAWDEDEMKWDFG